MPRRLSSHAFITLTLGLACQAGFPLTPRGLAFAQGSAGSGTRPAPPFADTLATLSAGGASTNREIARDAYNDPCFMGGRCSPVPVAVASPHRWAALALGIDHTCALADDDGGIYCWGGTDPRSPSRGAALRR